MLVPRHLWGNLGSFKELEHYCSLLTSNPSTLPKLSSHLDHYSSLLTALPAHLPRFWHSLENPGLLTLSYHTAPTAEQWSRGELGEDDLSSNFILITCHCHFSYAEASGTAYPKDTTQSERYYATLSPGLFQGVIWSAHSPASQYLTR